MPSFPSLAPALPAAPPERLPFPMSADRAQALGLDASDLLPLELAQTGDALMDRQYTIHPLDSARVEAAAMAQLNSLFNRFPDLDGLSLTLWSWRLFPFADKNASEDPARFLTVEPQRFLKSKDHFFGPLLSPACKPDTQRPLPIRTEQAHQLHPQRQKLPNSSLSSPLTLDELIAAAREELSVWACPPCSRHLLASGWGSLCHSQSLSSGWGAGRVVALRSAPIDSLTPLFPAGASLLQAQEFESHLAHAAPSALNDSPAAPNSARRSL